MPEKRKFGQTWSIEDAHRVAAKCKVHPKEVYYDIESVSKLNDVIGGEKGAGNVQQKLLEASNANTLPKAKPGIKSEIVYWDGDDALVIGYDPDGNMAGFGKVHKHPQSDKFDTNGVMSTYIAEYVVIPIYERNGMAKHMMAHLENEIAVNNTGIGATILYDVQAETVTSKETAMRLIQSVDAIAPIEIHPYFLRTLVKKEQTLKFRTQDQGLQVVNPRATGKVLKY